MHLKIESKELSLGQSIGFCMGDRVACKLVQNSRARSLGLSRRQVFVLCSWVGHFTLTMHFSGHAYR